MRHAADYQIDFDGKKGDGAYPAQIASDDIDDMLQSSYGDVVRVYLMMVAHTDRRRMR
jgi:hypothetical protein